jgi:two-component system cell cycle sensor histidine kinase/response regulator CckA
MPHTILVVEDEPELRELVEFVLSEAGYQVLAAASGEKALEVVDGQDIDLLLTDVRMRGMGGFALAKKLRDQRPTVKVLYVTGYPDDMEKLGSPGLFGKLLWKPLLPSQIIAEVREALGE